MEHFELNQIQHITEFGLSWGFKAFFFAVPAYGCGAPGEKACNRAGSPAPRQASAYYLLSVIFKFLA